MAPLVRAIKLPTLMKHTKAPITVPYICNGMYSSIYRGVATDYIPLANPCISLPRTINQKLKQREMQTPTVPIRQHRRRVLRRPITFIITPANTAPTARPATLLLAISVWWNVFSDSVVHSNFKLNVSFS